MGKICSTKQKLTQKPSMAEAKSTMCFLGINHKSSSKCFLHSSASKTQCSQINNSCNLCGLTCLKMYLKDQYLKNNGWTVFFEKIDVTCLQNFLLIFE